VNLYWVDGTNVMRWDGSTVLTVDGNGGSTDKVGTLVLGPDRLLVAQALQNESDWWTSETDFNLTVPLTVRADILSNGILLSRKWQEAIGVYEAASDAYWLYVWHQGNANYYNNSNWEHWAKVAPDGSLISVHVSETWNFTLNPDRAQGSNAVLHNGFLYWTTEGALWRYDIAGDVTTWLDYRSAPGRTYWSRLVGVLDDGRFVFTNGGMTSPYDIYFDIVDLSAASWGPATGAGGALPVAMVSYVAADSAAGMEASWRNEAGWSVISGTTCYFGASETADGLAIWSMDMTNGEVAKVVGLPTGFDVYGMVAQDVPQIDGLPLDSRRRFT
jgi:hypothetical protein